MLVCVILNILKYYLTTFLFSRLFETLQCAESSITEVVCLRPYAQLMMDFFRGSSQSNIDMICGDYNEQADTCDRLPPPKTTKINRYNYVNILTLIIDILASIKDVSTVPFNN